MDDLLLFARTTDVFVEGVTGDETVSGKKRRAARFARTDHHAAALVSERSACIDERQLEPERIAEDGPRHHHAAQPLVSVQLAARRFALFGHRRRRIPTRERLLVPRRCDYARAMGFAPSDALNETLGRLRRFVDDELVPLESALWTEGFVALVPKLEEKRARARELGFWAPHLPKEHGGMGLSIVDVAFVSEVLGRTPLGHYAVNMQAPDVGNMEILLSHGTPEQRARFFEPLARGEIRSCFAMTEPEHAGSNPVWMSTRAKVDGDSYVIDGNKWFTTGADGAAFAIVMAVTDPDAEPHRRATQILVPADTPGFRIVRNLPVMGSTGGGWASHSEVRFEGCRVPRSNRLGAEGAGFAIAQERLGPGRIHHCMRWMGICSRAFDLMCTRAASRELSPGRPLGTQQIVQSWIAESRAEIDAARLMVLDAATRMEREGSHAARDAISLIKFFAAGVLERVLDRALQVHGGLGMLDETPLAFWYREERAARLYDGPDEVHKASVARRILRRYGMAKSS